MSPDAGERDRYLLALTIYARRAGFLANTVWPKGNPEPYARLINPRDGGQNASVRVIRDGDSWFYRWGVSGRHPAVDVEEAVRHFAEVLAVECRPDEGGATE